MALEEARAFLDRAALSVSHYENGHHGIPAPAERSGGSAVRAEVLGAELTIRATIVLLGPGAVEARAWDPDGRREPKLRPADLLDETRRGLAIVTALSGGRCGWYRTNPSGKVIWAEFGGTI